MSYPEPQGQDKWLTKVLVALGIILIGLVLLTEFTDLEWQFYTWVD
jgi:hypothetical protein